MGEAPPSGDSDTVSQAGPGAGVAEAADLPPVDPDRYQVEGEIARGGGGRLLRAIDRRLGRLVAIKVLRRRGAFTESRFHREAQLTARLEHPAIVPVHDFGRWSTGEPFYAMKLVAGKTLKELIAAAPGLDDRLVLIPNLLA